MLQFQTVRTKGLSVEFICGDDEDQKEMKENVIFGKFQIVFFTPKALILNRRWRQLIGTDKYQKRVKGLIIDEAHTIKKWYAWVIYSYPNYIYCFFVLLGALHFVKLC